MNTIALETSVQPGSVAMLRDERILAATELPASERTAQSFAVQLDAGLTAAGWSASDVDLFVVCRGPGSFTGLRIGVTAGKTFAYATGCQLLALDTLEVIASRLPPHAEESWVVMDAQRHQLYVASFRITDEDLIRTSPTRIVDELELWESLRPGQLVAGPGLKNRTERIPSATILAERELWSPTAESLGQLGSARFQAGERDDFWRVVPAYFRQSAAEEKWQQRQQE